MKRISILFGFACLLGSVLQAQPFTSSGTTSVQVTVPFEAALAVNTATSSLTTTKSDFSSDFTGTTSLTYKIRTTGSSGAGNITLKVTTDFNGTGGPSVATPPSSGDALSYTCTLSSPGTGCSGSQTSSTTSSTPVGTFGSGASSTKSWNAASLGWNLTDDPAYATGTYTATVTFTISAT